MKTECLRLVRIVFLEPASKSKVNLPLNLFYCISLLNPVFLQNSVSCHCNVTAKHKWKEEFSEYVVQLRIFFFLLCDSL